MVAGIFWCFNPNACGEPCDQVCAALGLPLTISNVAWFAAQDTAAECQAINDAFGLGGAVSMAGYTYACSEDQFGPHAGPGPMLDFMPPFGDSVRAAGDLGMYGQTFLLS